MKVSRWPNWVQTCSNKVSFKESEVKISDKVSVIISGIDIDYIKHEVLKYTKIV
jgi:hypothetical protein